MRAYGLGAFDFSNPFQQVASNPNMFATNFAKVAPSTLSTLLGNISQTTRDAQAFVPSSPAPTPPFVPGNVPSPPTASATPPGGSPFIPQTPSVAPAAKSSNTPYIIAASAAGGLLLVGAIVVARRRRRKRG